MIFLEQIERKLLFFPTQYPEGDWSPPNGFEDIWIERDQAGPLHGWMLRVPESKLTLIYHHGNAGHLADRRPAILKLQAALNASLVIFDYSGYGRSGGAPDGAQIMQDGLLVYDWVQMNVAEKQRMVLLGRSLGGAVATYVASKRSVDTLILESTFASLTSVAKVHYPWLPAEKIMRHPMKSIDLIKNFSGQLILSHGAKDEIIPYSNGEQLFAAAPGTKHFLPYPDLGHNDPLPAQYYLKLRELLNNQ
jgi:hypothetical protein